MEIMKKMIMTVYIITCVIVCGVLITSCSDTKYWDNIQRETTKQGVLKYCDYLKVEIAKDFSDDPAKSDKYLSMIYHIEGYFVNTNPEVYSDGFEDRIDSIISNQKDTIE